MVEIQEDRPKYTIVKLSDVLVFGTRFEATVFDLAGKESRELVNNCGCQIKMICGKNGIASAYHRPRFKRIWVDDSGLPIYQPASILDLNPQPSGYISENTETDIDALRVKEHQILLTCSGTIGNTSIVTKRLNNEIFSHDLIRIDTHKVEDVGYLYAYLNTDIGRSILESNNYGAVISHIEPEHLDSVPIPYCDEELRIKISNLIIESFNLKDQANFLMEEADQLLKDKLSLKNMKDIDKGSFSQKNDIENYSVKLTDTKMRFDASFCKPVYNNLIREIKHQAIKTINLGDPEVTKSIILAGVFKRIYVGADFGYPFLGGREITQFNPKIEKYLSKKHHQDRYMKELRIKENTILVTDRGTIGKVAITPKHWNDYAVSQNVIKIECVDRLMTGYVYAFLASEYGTELIKRETYGSVVNMIDDNNMRNIQVPILKNEEDMKLISDKVLEANEKRHEAYIKHQKAINLMNEEVFNINVKRDSN